MLASWHERHGASLLSQLSYILQLGHILQGSGTLLIRYEQDWQKQRIPSVIGLLSLHLQKNAACLHNSLTVVILRDSSSVKVEVLCPCVILTPIVFATYLAAPKIISSLDLFAKVGRLSNIFLNCCILIEWVFAWTSGERVLLSAKRCNISFSNCLTRRCLEASIRLSWQTQKKIKILSVVVTQN